MQRIAGLLALTLTAALLVGCAYDPYTGTYAPCCGYYGNPYYGNPYYRYPPPDAPYGYPSGPYMAQPPSQPGTYASPPSDLQPAPYAPQQSQPGTYESPPTQLQQAPYAPPQQSQPGYPPPPGQSPSAPDAAASPAGGVPAGPLAVISVTHDGRLTRDQTMAGMPLVARGFGSM